MELREVTREIMDLVEKETGFPVRVIADPSLTTLSSMRMARGSVPAHFISYKPAAGEVPDYAIIHQCGFILRKFAVPPEDRFDFAPSPTGQEEVHHLLTGPGGIARKYKLTDQQVAALEAQLFNGLMLHLMSVPLSLRVYDWVYNGYPQLHELQQAQVAKELAENRAGMSPQIRDSLPEKIYKSTHAIGAAFAMFWADKYGRPDIKAAYRFDFQKEGSAALSPRTAHPASSSEQCTAHSTNHHPPRAVNGARLGRAPEPARQSAPRPAARPLCQQGEAIILHAHKT